MGILIDFLVDNYVYFIFVAILLVLALIGYIVDNKRTDKVRKELSLDKNDEVELNIPDVKNVKLNDTIKASTMTSPVNLNPNPSLEQFSANGEEKKL